MTESITESSLARRPARSLAATLLVALSLQGCTDIENWCDSRHAKMLREREAPAGPYRTVHDLMAIEKDDPIAIIAHRGGYHCEDLDGAPENSLPNVEKAIRMGFDGIETDVWMSADGEFVIHHDETLDRTTTGTGPVTARTLDELKALKLKYPSGKISDERIPTLRELLAAGAGRTLFLMELKGRAAEHFPELLQIARETGALDHAIFWIDWSEDNTVRYRQYLDSGIEEARTNVIWRARDMHALNDVIAKLDPIIVDVVPLQDELNTEEGYTGWLLGVLPPRHFEVVRAAQDAGVKVLVSKVITNSYTNGLGDEGVRVFMSRAPEVQLSYLIRKGRHH